MAESIEIDGISSGVGHMGKMYEDDDASPLIISASSNHQPFPYTVKKQSFCQYLQDNPIASFLLAFVMFLIFATALLYSQGHIVIVSNDLDSKTLSDVLTHPSISKGTTIQIDGDIMTQTTPDGGVIIRSLDKVIPGIPTIKTADGRVMARPVHMLVVSRHGGTTADLTAIGETMGWKVSEVSLASFLPFGTKFDEQFDKFHHSEIIKAMCHDYDIIGVSDVIWDAWPFLKYSECDRKLLLVMTNRFDIYLENPDGWHRDLKAVLERNNFNYPVMTANNPYEEFFLGHHNFKLPTNTDHNRFNPLIPVIRSLGLSAVPFDSSAPLVKNAPDCLFYNHDSGSEHVYQSAKDNGFEFNCKFFTLPYGGPTFLYKNNAPFIFIPYQVSVMKMWESVRAGLIMVIPSVRFLAEIIKVDYGPFYLVGDPIMLLEKAYGPDESTWAHIIDFYNDAFAPCAVEFNSWESLNTIIKTQSWRKQQVICQQYSRLFPSTQLVYWHKLFQERFPQIPLAPYDKLQIEAATKYSIPI